MEITDRLTQTMLTQKPRFHIDCSVTGLQSVYVSQNYGVLLAIWDHTMLLAT